MELNQTGLFADDCVCYREIKDIEAFDTPPPLMYFSKANCLAMELEGKL